MCVAVRCVFFVFLQDTDSQCLKFCIPLPFRVTFLKSIKMQIDKLFYDLPVFVNNATPWENEMKEQLFILSDEN